MSDKPLPPDPDGENYKRGLQAYQTLRAFERNTTTEFAMCDLLSCLMHFCDRSRFDFDEQLAAARENYRREITPEK